ncbi:MAG: ergothioneine biosynthesis glutamate--cysteine ligase EgtA [Actinobacteria bacterium]|nr:MAG: ergothioneine biosynthesis glutamate--cysteine ligase EgtA [Actinomycetota bacterium]
MPSSRRRLDLDGVRRHLRDHAFERSAGRVGVELEWLAAPASDPTRACDFSTVLTASDVALPNGSRVTFEPGGQPELSSCPFPTIGATCEAVAADLSVFRSALARRGVRLIGTGLDPVRRPQRVLDLPRYTAMEAYFASDGDGACGRTMMALTAAIQVNVDAGPPEQVDARWRLAHDLGPVLAASFANSPFRAGRPSGWRSTRLGNWYEVDRTRTAPAHNGDAASAVDAWSSFVLAANVMLIRASELDFVPVRTPMRFDEWLAGGHALGFPSIDDLDYHVTTLFPPVRPRGWLELRMIDALPDPWWRVAVAVAVTLLDDAEASAIAARAVTGARSLWVEAARDALAHPFIACAARACFDAALPALARAGADDLTIELAHDYHERYVSRGRCPADELLDAWRHDGSLFATGPLVEAP